MLLGVLIILFISGLASLTIHALIKKYALAVLLTPFVTCCVVLLLSGPARSDRWSVLILSIVCFVSVATSLLVGLPFASSRRRAMERQRGFPVLPVVRD